MDSPNIPLNGPPLSPTFTGQQAYFAFDNTYARLPEHFYARLDPTPVAAPRIVKVNVELARELGLNADALTSERGVAVLAGNRVADGAEPIALAYAGHQFGCFVPQLGDGRANLLGELVSRDGQRHDVQLKGSGRTPFSRGGDGRAALGPVLREYIVSEAMAALGVPTTRALAAVTTGERVLRDTVLPGAVLTRVAASHLRVGTFQYFAARGDVEGLRMLADYAIARHYPEAAQAKEPYRALLEGVIARQAQLIAQWMLLGFIHGVMNTDNTSISGETIDYGPCAFMDQPRVAPWNVARLAKSLLPVLAQESGSEEAGLVAANDALSAFEPQFEATHSEGLRRKLGLVVEREGDAALAENLLQCMAANRADFTLTFRRLCDAAAGPEGDAGVRALFADPTAYDCWAAGWRRRLEEEFTDGQARTAAMRRINPAFIPRNHLVEAALDAANFRLDFQPFEDLLAVISRPYDERPELERYSKPARPEERVLQTFCGT
jgi:uncharacterized protein YdiU (UPF0061 family)